MLGDQLDLLSIQFVRLFSLLDAGRQDGIARSPPPGAVASASDLP